MRGGILWIAITAMMIICSSALAADSGRIVQFNELDANHDGTITKEELQKVPKLDQYWQTLDINHDGKVERAEFAQFEVIETSKPAGKPGPDTQKPESPPEK